MRDFQRIDIATASPVAIVNDAFVRRFFRDRNPLGATIGIPAGGRGAQMRDIVGVVADAVYAPSRIQPMVGSLALREAVPPTIYLPLTQGAGIVPPNPTDIRISVRAQGRPAALGASVGATLTSIDRNLTYTFRPLADDVSAALMPERLVARVSSMFGILSLVLAAVGLYGLTSYDVNRRRTEIAIRLALGAVPANVVRLVLARIAVLLTAGVIVGVSGSFWLSGYIATLLYDLRPRDPVTLAGAASLLAFVAAVAACLPAYRASRVQPAEVLRHN